jgi:uncharacterized DUF497 family protein
VSDLILEAKNIDDEKRYAIIGKLDGKCYFCVFTLRNDKIRINKKMQKKRGGIL